MSRFPKILFAPLLGVVSFLILPAQPIWADKSRTKDSPEIIIESVDKGSAAEKAGMQAGDSIVSWSRAASLPANPLAAQGQLGSPLDLTVVEAEQGPRGEVTFSGRHNKQESHWVLQPGVWGLQTRPVLAENLLDLYQQGRNLVVAKKTSEGVKRWLDAAAAAQKNRNMLLAIWFSSKAAEASAEAGDWTTADSAYETAAKQAEQAGQLIIAAELLRDWGRTFLKRKALDQAESTFRRELTLNQKSAPESLAAASTLHNLGTVQLKRNDYPGAQDFFQKALAIREKLAPDSLPVAAALNDIAVVLLNNGDPSVADKLLRRALVIKEKLTPGSAGVSSTLSNLGLIAEDRSDFPAAEDFFNRSLAIDEKLSPDSLDVADSLSHLGDLALDRGDTTAAEQFHRRALSIEEKHDPNGSEVAGSLVNLGNVAWTRGNLTEAESFYRRGLEIRSKLNPGSPLLATVFNNLGAVNLDMGELAAAESLFHQALAIRQKLIPESIATSQSLLALGVASWQRGNLNEAEEYLRQALALQEKLTPGSLNTAASLTNLGTVAMIRRDMKSAEDYHRRALAIYEKFAPESRDTLKILNNLAIDAEILGELSTAEGFYRRILASYEKNYPGTMEYARSLTNMGQIAFDHNDLSAAEQYFKQGLAIREKLAPAGMDVAGSYSALGELAFKQDNFSEAETRYRQGLVIYRKLAPGSVIVAESLRSIGLTLRRQQKLQLAAAALCGAVDALEAQRAKLGGTEETRTNFGAQYATYYQDCIEIQLELDRPGDAFHTLERSRARSLLNMLAERDLLFAADLPPDLARQRKLAYADYDKTQSALGNLSAVNDTAEIERLTTHLREVRDNQQAIVEQIRKTSPRFAALQYPQPLDLAGVRDALDPGSVFLAYYVGGEKSFLFVVQPAAAKTGASALSVIPLSIGEKALREKVQAFRNVIERHNNSDQQLLNQQGGDLYDLLVRPAEQWIAADERILIAPDGPLHVLPFAALLKNEKRAKKRETRRYLIEWKPIHTVVSATVYAELKKSRRDPASAEEFRMTAFGDPKYPVGPAAPGQIANVELRSAVTRGFGLVPLPSTRVEVESIANLFPSSTLKYIGEQATEERAKSVGKDVRYLHFAVHGLLDEQFPLNSSLALTIPENPAAGQDNGLLQAWEIFEQVHIDADLVTLSACETALGKEMGGEGLVGLTRAFQYAGAHSVLASLWSVSDESTAELMKRFYGYLKAGKSKDEALRVAQIDFIKSTAANAVSPSELSHPFHWAAFQLTGDWK